MHKRLQDDEDAIAEKQKRQAAREEESTSMQARTHPRARTRTHVRNRTQFAGDLRSGSGRDEHGGLHEGA